MKTFPEDTLTLVREVPATTRSLLTIVVCAFRHAALIGECLEAIDAAAAPDVELIIIDDGSPDDTLRVCSEHAFDPRLPLRLFTKKNAGLIDSLRRGLHLARGGHVAFIGSDDAFSPEGIRTVLGRLRAGTWNDDATLCQAIAFGNVEEAPVYGQGMHDLFEQSPEQRFRTICLQVPKPMLLQATIFRTAFLRELDPWRHHLELDDWPAFIEVFKAEAQGRARVTFAPELILSRYRMHEGGVHKQLARQLRITEAVALKLVPAALRRRSLADIRIQFGLTYLYQGHAATGLSLCARALLSCPTPDVVGGFLRRCAKFVQKRLVRRSPRAGGV